MTLWTLTHGLDTIDVVLVLCLRVSRLSWLGDILEPLLIWVVPLLLLLLHVQLCRLLTSNHLWVYNMLVEVRGTEEYVWGSRCT